MCDPTIMAVASMASGLADAAGQAGAQAKQKQAYDEWFAQQEKNRIAENAKQEQSRQMAAAAANTAVQQVSAPNQEKALSDEQSRLDQYLYNKSGPLAQVNPTGDANTPVDTSVADKFLLSGQQSGDDVFKTDLATKINQAAKDTRARIAALASVSAYGPSSGGLDTYASNVFTKSGGAIDKANDFRRGDLAVYGTQQAVNPVQYTYTPGIKI